MATNGLNKVVYHLRRAVLLKDGGGQTDGKLLGNFIENRDETAFEVLMRRHGPMVLGVCRRFLRNPQDAQDAFQATFLVLVRKANSVVPRELVGNWLYAVARQTAIRMRSLNAKRWGREKQVRIMPEPQAVLPESTGDLQHLLDQELSRLPETYRIAIVLCELEGKTRKQAAQQLGWAEGTVSSRLARGKAKLAKRLAKQGLLLSVEALAAVLSQNMASACLPPTLVSATVKAASIMATGQTVASSLISAKVVALTERVVKTMLLTKLKTMVTVLFVAGVVGIGAGTFSVSALADNQVEAQKQEGPRKEQQVKAVQEKDDLEKNEMAALEGTWKVVFFERDGKIHEQNEGKDVKNYTKVVIKGNKFTIHPHIGGPRTSTFKIDSTKRPKWFDDVPDGTKSWPGIYELENDILKIYFDSKGVLKRPTEFKTTQNSGLALFVLNREKIPPEQENLKGPQQVGNSAPSALEIPEKERSDDPKKSSKQPAIEDSKIRELRKERVQVLQQRVNVLAKTYQARRWTPRPINTSDIKEAFRQLLKAELELCQSDQESLLVQLTAAKEYEKVADDMRKTGFIGEDEFLAAVANRLEIEIAYEREKAKATKAK